MGKTRYVILVVFLIFVSMITIQAHQVNKVHPPVQSNDMPPYRVVSSSIAIDGEHSTYIAGTFFNDLRVDSSVLRRFIAIDKTSAGFSKTYNGGSSDGFVIKLDATGENIEYATFIGGNGRDWINSIAVDENGYLYVAGFTESNEDSFPIGGNIPGFQRTFSGSSDGFIMKIDTKNDEIVYSTYLGGDSGDDITSIAVDYEGNVYAGGTTTSTEDSFPIGGNIPGYLQEYRGSKGSLNGFLIKLHHEGTQLEYSTYLRTGSGGDIEIKDLSVDNKGYLFVAGSTSCDEHSFPVGNEIPGFESKQKGFFDGFVMKLNPTGTSFQFSTFIGGTGDDSINAIDIDLNGAIYLTGETSDGPKVVNEFFSFPVGSNYPGYNTIYHASGTFLIKLDSSGTTIEYATYLSISGKNVGVGLRVTEKGEAIVAVNTYDGQLPVHRRIPGIEKEYKGGHEGYIVKFNPNGTMIDFSTFIGGNTNDSITSLALDTAGKVYVTGTTLSTENDDFPIGQDLPGYNSAYNLRTRESFVISLDLSSNTYHFSTYLSQK